MSASEGLVARVIGWCASHPFIVVITSIAITVASAIAISRTPVDAIPDLSDRQVIVFTEWMGRSPTLVEDQITYPLTTAMLGTPRVKAVRGQSMFGMSFVYVIFEDGTDIYWAQTRILERIQQTNDTLPEGVQPRLGPDASGVGWVYQYALLDRSRTHSLGDLRAFQDFSLRYALESVPGVAEVASVGGYEKQYEVTVFPDRLRSYGLSIADVGRAIRTANRDVGGGSIEVAGQELIVRGRGYLRSAEDIGNVVLEARGPGVPIRVSDVARVTIGAEPRRGIGELDGRGEAVGGIVVARDGANAMEVISRVKARLHELRGSFPDGVDVVPVYDRSKLIGRAIDTLRTALTEEIIVVALVILLFLLHVRSSLLPVVVLPISIAAAFIPMYLLGLSSNIMSLGGIAIAIGAMVDATIVIVENAHKRLDRAGPSIDPARRRQILVDSAKEVGPPIFFALLILTVSFLPIFGLVGQGGRLFRPLAFTKTFAMASAAIFAVTLGPALLTWLVRGRIISEERHPISRTLIRAYKPFVYVALHNPKTTLLIGLFAVASAIPLLPKLGSEFMPALDEGDVLYMPTTTPGLSTEEAARALSLQDRMLRALPEVESVYGKIGRADTPTDPAPLDMVETIVQLKPPSKWRRVTERRWWSSWAPGFIVPVFRWFWPDKRAISHAELIAEMTEAARLPGWTAALTMPVKTRIDMLSTGVRTPVGIKVLGDDLATIERVGRHIEGVVREIEGTRGVFAERLTSGAYLDVVPRTEALARYGLSNDAVLELVEMGIGGSRVTTMIDGRARYGVVARYPRDTRLSVEAVRNLVVPVGNIGEDAFLQVPLGELADVRHVSGPSMIKNEAGRLAGYVYIDVDESKRDLGSYVEEAKQKVHESIDLPAGFELSWTGQYEQLRETTDRMTLLLPLTLALVVALLFVHLRNPIEVAIVLLSVPFSLVGSVWALYLLDYRMSTAVWVGIIALVGLASQTGIMMVMYLDEAYERRRREGKIRSLEDIILAHEEGTVQRVRPKVMTVMTTMAGLVPLLWATGTGADVMRRIAAPMVGGLVTSLFLTLELLPVVYTYWRYAQLRAERRAGVVTAVDEGERV